MRIKNWDKYQHYKHRHPPWVKLHFCILTSSDWVMLDDASKLLAVVCMLIASKHDGNIPETCTPAYFKRVAFLDKLPDFKPLIECGFLIETLADASESKQLRTNAYTEKSRVRVRVETETEKKRAVRVRRVPTPLADNWIPTKESREFGESLGLKHLEIERELIKFRRHAKDKNRLCVLWDKAFNSWLGIAADFLGKTPSEVPKETDLEYDEIEKRWKWKPGKEPTNEETGA